MKYLLLILTCLLLFVATQQRFDYLQPFHCTLDGKTYFIAYDGDKKFTEVHFEDSLKYGIYSDEPRRILPVEYEKIYNPNLTLLDCFEIKKDGKVGMFNYKTGEILEPRFDYIMPSGKKATNIAYGFVDGRYFKVGASKLMALEPVDFDPRGFIAAAEFSLKSVRGNEFKHSYLNEEDNQLPRKHAVVVPSWLEHLKLLPNSFYWEVYPLTKYSSGQQATVTVKFEKTLSEKLWAFILDVYESGVDVRDYTLEAEKMIVYNSEEQKLSSVELYSNSQRSYLCIEGEYRAISNFLIELKKSISEYDLKNQLYNFETQYSYLTISENGQIIPLQSNRHFDFTKFIKIEERHLEGCFGVSMDPSERDIQYNVWASDHLSIEDLDIMRNEIFADYGYRFKSEKWQKYFGKQPWYLPRAADVNSQLTDIDKANIQFILSMKKKMTGREQEFTKRRKSRYDAAG